jgi:hypothetical protein
VLGASAIASSQSLLLVSTVDAGYWEYRIALLRAPADPTNSYGFLRFLRILQSSLDSKYYCVYIGDLRPIENCICKQSRCLYTVRNNSCHYHHHRWCCTGCEQARCQEPLARTVKGDFIMSRQSLCCVQFLVFLLIVQFSNYKSYLLFQFRKTCSTR